jgi:hypothetical protein
MEQTAVEWLYDQMLKPLSKWPDNLWENAKEMEKQQLINELKLIGNHFDVSKLDAHEQRHHIRFTSIIKDRIEHYEKKIKEYEICKSR